MLFQYPQNRFNRFQRISFEAIVHVNVSFGARLVAFAFQNHSGGGGAGFFVGFFGVVVGLEGFDGVFVFAAGFEEESRGDQTGIGAAAG